mgnify:CR=1 FL=1
MTFVPPKHLVAGRNPLGSGSAAVTAEVDEITGGYKNILAEKTPFVKTKSVHCLSAVGLSQY